MISFKKIFASFGFALSGIKEMLQEEQSFRIMLFTALVITIAMFYFDLPLIQKTVLFIMIVLVLILESLNSVIEKFLDIIHPQKDSRVRVIKDVMAGIVLLSCIGATIIGILIFLPHILK